MAEQKKLEIEQAQSLMLVSRLDTAQNAQAIHISMDQLKAERLYQQEEIIEGCMLCGRLAKRWRGITLCANCQ
jgi:hypothetical protein